MTPGARIAAAIELVAAIELPDTAPDRVRERFFRERRYIGSKDRHAVNAMVFDVLRARARAAWWIAREGKGLPVDARMRTIAALALARGSSPGALIEAFTDGRHRPDPLSLAETALIRRLAGRTADHPEMAEAVRLECPEWIWPRLQARFGEGLAAEMAALNREAPVDLRVNALKATREEALAALWTDGLSAAPTPHSPLGLRLAGRPRLSDSKAWRDGLVEVQDEGSQLVALLADARPGQAVLDYCAGAGGKTLALAAAMKNSGRLVAGDVADWRLKQATERLRRAGVSNVTPRLLSEQGGKWAKRAAGTFDRVLVDAPCTGTGTWRRDPAARWHLAETGLAELESRQRGIVATAARLVKPGGRLIYATCSVLAEEDEAQVERLLAERPEFRLLPVPAVWAATVGGACPADSPMLLLTPARTGTDGFFVAVLERAA